MVIHQSKLGIIEPRKNVSCGNKLAKRLLLSKVGQTKIWPTKSIRGYSEHKISSCGNIWKKWIDELLFLSGYLKVKSLHAGKTRGSTEDVEEESVTALQLFVDRHVSCPCITTHYVKSRPSHGFNIFFRF